jgi:Tfp pilus assembly protein PilX
MATPIRRARGVALVIALVLLLIVTLLATGGMMTATAELVMAGNEKFHRRAIDAASAGVEVALARIEAAAGGEGSVFVNEGPASEGEYRVSSRYAGEETNLPGFSAGKFAALHFEIDSTGHSWRGAQDRQLQGVMVIGSRDSTETFTRIEDGLDDEGRGT